MSNYAGDLTSAQAWKFLNENPDAQLVDVRTPGELQFVGIPDTSPTGREALFIDWTQYPEESRGADFIAALKEAGLDAQSGPLVFLCRSGVRSAAAAAAATEAGYGPCYNISDGFEGRMNTDGHRGWEGWQAEKLPWQQS